MQIEAIFKNYTNLGLLTKINCQNHHLQSTPADNLIEACGRICYDSFDQVKSRSSVDYHKHINDVGHGSVQEHTNFTIRLQGFQFDDSLMDIRALTYESIINRPGCHYDFVNGYDRITTNIRSAIEWYEPHVNHFQLKYCRFGEEIRRHAKLLCPMACTNISPKKIENPLWIIKGELVSPETLEEKWISFRLQNVSRNLTHELVRHKWQTAISQRSTRYVNESDSDWAWHPLIKEYKTEIDDLLLDHFGCEIVDVEEAAGFMYGKTVDFLETKLVEKGISKLTSRKQARGAARGFLGTCLSSELIFSASVAQWIRICEMRASEHADAEIRIMANKVWNELEKDFPDITNQYDKVNCPDGIGYGIIKRAANNLE